jgi:transporter family protein
MLDWLPASLIALLIYGLWGFFPKLAVQDISPSSALLWEVAGALLVGAGVLASLHGRPDMHPRGVLFAVLTGVTGMAGTLFFFMAARQGKISLVVSITALYPLVTILLAVIFLGEKLSGKQLGGILSALIAIYLLTG